MDIKIGADPELFVKPIGMEHPVSAFGLIPGTKKKPYPIEGGAVQVDGMALEFNIVPAESCVEFMERISSVKNTMLGMLPKFEVFESSVAAFGSDYISKQPSAARELGCDPDYNAWTGRLNKPPDSFTPFRTAAGHIHIGWTEEEDIEDMSHVTRAFELCKQLDFYLGLPSLLFDPDKKRRELYGKAGACRVKPYGVEYRVLSNKWIHSEELTEFVYLNTEKAIYSLIEGNDMYLKEGDIQEIINTSDRDSATDILNRQGITYVH